MVFCPKCGTQNPENAQFCENCGYQLNAAANKSFQQPTEKKPVSGIVFVLIGVIILIVAVFGAYIIFGTDVFAEDAISEEGATTITNNIINNTTINYPGEAKNFVVSKPKRVKKDGKMIWQVPVKYTGTNQKIASVFNGNSVEIPVKGTIGNNGQIQVSITLPNGMTIDLTSGKNGVGNIAIITETTQIIPPETTSATSTSSGQSATSSQSSSSQSATSSQSTSSSQNPAAHPETGIVYDVDGDGQTEDWELVY